MNERNFYQAPAFNSSGQLDCILTGRTLVLRSARILTCLALPDLRYVEFMQYYGNDNNEDSKIKYPMIRLTTKDGCQETLYFPGEGYDIRLSRAKELFMAINEAIIMS